MFFSFVTVQTQCSFNLSNFANTALMKISAEGFDYDKKGDIEGLRYNVLLKFGYNKRQNQYLILKFV